MLQPDPKDCSSAFSVQKRHEGAPDGPLPSQAFTFPDLLAQLRRVYAQDLPPAPAGGGGAGGGEGMCIAFEDDEGEWIRMAGQADLDEARRCDERDGGGEGGSEREGGEGGMKGKREREIVGNT